VSDTYISRSYPAGPSRSHAEAHKALPPGHHKRHPPSPACMEHQVWEDSIPVATESTHELRDDRRRDVFGVEYDHNLQAGASAKPFPRLPLPPPQVSRGSGQQRCLGAAQATWIFCGVRVDHA
ncbi:unnamed protein product, partial [Ectocarpus sp. 6 AP-2014]